MSIESNPIVYAKEKGWKRVTCKLVFFKGETEESGEILRDDLGCFLSRHSVAYYKSQIASECKGENWVRFTADSEGANSANDLYPTEVAIIIERIE